MGISDFLKMINDVAPGVVGALIAGLYLFMVPLGLHWPLNAVMINNLQTMGTDFIQSPMGAYNFAVFGLVTGVAIRAKKDRELRQTAIGASIHVRCGTPLQARDSDYSGSRRDRWCDHFDAGR